MRRPCHVAIAWLSPPKRRERTPGSVGSCAVTVTARALAAPGAVHCGIQIQHAHPLPHVSRMRTTRRPHRQAKASPWLAGSPLPLLLLYSSYRGPERGATAASSRTRHQWIPDSASASRVCCGAGVFFLAATRFFSVPSFFFSGEVSCVLHAFLSLSRECVHAPAAHRLARCWQCCFRRHRTSRTVSCLRVSRIHGSVCAAVRNAPFFFEPSLPNGARYAS